MKQTHESLNRLSESMYLWKYANIVNKQSIKRLILFAANFMSWLMRTTANGRTALPCKFLRFNSILNLILIDGLFSNHKSNSILGLNLLTLKTVYNKFLTYLSRLLF